METKVCCLCKEERPVSYFSVRKSHWVKADGTRSLVISAWCRACTSERHKEWRKNGGQEKINKNVRAWYNKSEQNRKRAAELRKIHRQNNKELWRMYSRKHAARRQSRFKQAIPPWTRNEFHQKKIEQIYERARSLTKATGVEHQVDHIIPLRGKSVCGLHVAENLQILTRIENSRKRNNFIGD